MKQFLLKPCDEEEIKAALQNAQNELSVRKKDSFYRTLGENWVKCGLDNEKTVSDEKRETEEEKDFIDTILEYVRTHFYEEDLNLKWIAKEVVFLNEDYVSKQFRQRVGCKFTQYLNMLRVEEAKQRLASSNVSSEEIAAKVGYGNNPKYFAKVFKKYAGCTPKEYKNEQKT